MNEILVVCAVCGNTFTRDEVVMVGSQHHCLRCATEEEVQAEEDE